MKALSKGTLITSKNMVMIITGHSETAYLGYISYKGQAVGQCSLSFDMFKNPHYVDELDITLPEKTEG